MSEYYFFKGDINIKEGKVDEVYNYLLNTNYIERNENVLKKEGNVIKIDTIDYLGSAPLSLLERFKEKLLKVQASISVESTLEHYVEGGYGNKYYHIHLKPNSQELDMEEISESNPYTKVIGKEDVLEKLDDEFDNADDVIRRYHEVILNRLSEGKEVNSDFGRLILVKKTIPKRTGKNPQTGEVVDISARTSYTIELRGSPANWVLEELNKN